MSLNNIDTKKKIRVDARYTFYSFTCGIFKLKNWHNSWYNDNTITRSTAHYKL